MAAGASIGRVTSIRPTLSGELAVKGELLSLDYPVCQEHASGLSFANLLTRKTLGFAFLRLMVWVMGDGSARMKPTIAVALVLVAAMADAQTLYKCTSKEGKISFSDIPCPRDGRNAAKQEQKSTADPGVIGDAKVRVARVLGLPVGGISFQNVRVVTREGGFPDPHVCGAANGRRFVAAPADALAPFVVVEADSSLTTFLNFWNGKCAGAKGEAKISNDQGRFEEFKDALASQNDLLALAVIAAADGNVRQRMQAHAEGLCARDDRTACLMLDCPGGTLNDEAFHSPKCAQRMGRAYGDGWVESKFGRRSNWVEYSIKCTNRRGYVYVWCTQPRTECRRGMWTGRPDGVHGEPATLEQVAAKECSR